jgi:DNA-binding transcriptional LysR family regulator
MFDWNDLRHFLAVARHGSTIAAGKALGVNQSTVHRRLSELEARIGRELVSRHTAGYRVTEFGAELLPFAERVEAAVSELQQHVADGARDRRGTIRLTCPEPVVPRLLPLIDRFHARHPRFRVDLVTSDRYLDLLKGEADVAFRSGDTDDDLIGRKIADSIWAVYASRAYAERHGTPKRVEDLADHLLVSLDEKMASHRAVQWLQAVAPNARIASRNDSILGLVYAIKSGAGLGPLPTAIADGEADLVRVLGPIPELARSWRLLTYPDLRRSPRISAFFDFIVEERAALRAIFTG